MAEPNLGKLARGGALSLVGAACTGLMGFVLVVVVAKSYSVAVAGSFFAATSLFLILGATANLGNDAGLLRWLPRYLALGDRAGVRAIVPIALVPVLAMSVLAATVLAVAAPWLTGLVGSTDTDQVTTMLRLLALFMPVAAVQDLLLSATRGYGSMRPTVLIDRILRQIVQFGGVLLAALLAPDQPAALALGWALPYLPGMLAAVLAYHRLSRARRDPAPDEPQTPPRSTRALAGEFWRFTAPRSLAQICQTALQRSDIVLIAALSSAREAAIYTAATRFVIFGQLASQAVQQVAQPAISRQLALSDHAGAQRLLAVSSTWTVVLTWPVYLTVAAGAVSYLNIFSPEYAEAGLWVTVILALTMLPAMAAGPADVVLLMAGRSGLSLANNAAALVANIVLNVVLIPLFGVTGAAVARSVSLIIRNLLPLSQVNRLLRMSPTGAGLGLAAGSAVLCFGGPQLVTWLWLGTGLPALLTGLLPGLICYAWLLWFSRHRLALTAFRALLGRRSRGGGPAHTQTAPAKVSARDE